MAGSLEAKRYVSTRGGANNKSFEEALFSGYADDGGLFVPELIPKVPMRILEGWRTLSYPEIVQKVVSLYVTEEEIPQKDLKEIISNAFSRFDIEEVIKIVSFDDLNIAELWHGPSLAFKDLAMSCVGQFFKYFLLKRKKHVTVIVGTSGDTGSSAIEAVRGEENIDIIVILPHKRISKIQELMMTAVLDDNVHVYAADGFSDEFEVTIKSLFADEEFAKRHNLCSINSINWARVMVQIAHHIYMYLQTADEVGETVDIVIPTGGCGNIASGVFAEAMGIPARFVCVVNENDIVHRTVRSNDFRLAHEVKQTLACSMDIQVPPNFERILYLYSDKNQALCNTVMKQFDKSGEATIPKNLHDKICKTIRSAVVTDKEIIETQKICFERNKYLACPHTCAALAYYYGTSLHGTRESDGTRNENGKLIPMICAATAAIDKFPETLDKSGIDSYQAPVHITEMFQKTTRFVILEKGEDWEQTLRTKIELLSQRSVS